MPSRSKMLKMPQVTINITMLLLKSCLSSHSDIQNKEPKQLYDLIVFVLFNQLCLYFFFFSGLAIIHYELTLIWITLKTQACFHVKLCTANFSNKSTHLNSNYSPPFAANLFFFIAMLKSSFFILYSCNSCFPNDASSHFILKHTKIKS